MLISSSFLSNAAWHTTQVNDDLTARTPSDAARSGELSKPQLATPQRAKQINPQRKTAQEPSQAAKNSKPRHEWHGNKTHGSDRRAATHQEDAARTERHAEAHRRQARRAQQKSADDAQAADNQPTDQNLAVPANQEAESSPFLAILGDVLPQGAPISASANADDARAGSSGSHDQFSLLAQMGLGSGLPSGIATQNLTVSLNVSAAGSQTALTGNSGVAEKTSEPAVASAADATGAHRQTELSAFDGAFAVKTQATASGPGTGQAQKQTEVAFAARIAERTTTGAALGLNDAQATIAASRFDASGTGSQSGGNGHGAPHSGESNQTAQPDPYSEAAQEQTASTASAAQPDVQHATAAQNAAVRTGGAQPGLPAGRVEPAAAAHASSASPSVMNGTPVAAAPSSTAAGAGTSGPAKVVADDRSPQFLEPQNETSQRAGETVRDISLKLTNQDQSTVQVRLSERAGELHVSVRTPDAGLTRGLREGLSDLVGRLEQSGYRAETWRPADNGSTGQDQGRENPSQQHSSQQQNGGGSGTDSHQQQNPRDQQQPGAHTPEWVGELESSLQRSNRSWLPSATR